MSLAKHWSHMTKQDGVAETVGRMQVYFDTIGIISALNLAVVFTALTAPPEQPRSRTAQLSAVFGCASFCGYMLSIMVAIMQSGFYRTRTCTTKREEHSNKFLDVIVEYQHFYPLPERLFILASFCMCAQLVAYSWAVYGPAVSCALMGMFALVIAFLSWMYCSSSVGNKPSVQRPSNGTVSQGPAVIVVDPSPVAVDHTSSPSAHA